MSISCYKDYTLVIQVPYQEYWRLDSLSGGNYLGSIQNTPMVPTDIGSVAGIISNGAGLSLNTSTLIASSASSMAMSASNGTSMSAWVKCNIGGVAANGLTIAWSWPDALGTSGRMRITVSSLTLAFGADAIGAGASWSVNSTAGAWHHVVVTWNKSTTTFCMYFDGALVKTAVVLGGISGSSPTGYIKQSVTTTTDSFDTDEIGVWGNHVLSLAEVLAIWNGGAGARPSGV